ncbi:MAG: DUF1800 domain-containing protein [bacterium]
MPEVARASAGRRSPDQTALARRRAFLSYDPRLENLSQDDDFSPEMKLTIDPARTRLAQNGLSIGGSDNLSFFQGGTISWGAAEIRHLFGRASFGLSVADAHALLALPKESVLDHLLQDAPLPEPPGLWVAEPFDRTAFSQLTPEEQQAWQRQNRQRLNEVRGWWIALMLTPLYNLRERMTYFWHNHFTSDIRTVQLAQFVYLQNATWRRHALGNFAEFLKAMYKDPAMLIYLNGDRNVARQPNENFARELLELFTMGVGNYSENDVQEAARAFTGWQVDQLHLAPVFNPRRHDAGRKTFLGRAGNFAGDDIIDIILAQPVTAEFICRKLCAAFLNREVENDFVQQLAQVFRSNHYELKPVLRELFSSDLFYGDQAVGALIKSPIEMAVGNARMFARTQLNLRDLLTACAELNQDVLNPPSVAGWPGQRDWISPTTFVSRNAFSESFITGGRFDDPGGGRGLAPLEIMKFARSFGPTQARELAHAMADHLLAVPLAGETFEALLAVLVGTADPEDWSLDYPGAEQQVKDFLVALVRQPEFHLI